MAVRGLPKEAAIPQAVRSFVVNELKKGTRLSRVIDLARWEFELSLLHSCNVVAAVRKAERALQEGYEEAYRRG